MFALHKSEVLLVFSVRPSTWITDFFVRPESLMGRTEEGLTNRYLPSIIYQQTVHAYLMESSMTISLLN